MNISVLMEYTVFESLTLFKEMKGGCQNASQRNKESLTIFFIHMT